MSTKINMYELYFQWWLETLENYNLAKNIKREPETYTITDGIVLFYNQHYKRKGPLIKSSNIASPLVYTYDYSVELNTILVNKLIGIVNNEKMIEDYSFNGPGNVYQNTLFYAFDSEINNGFVKVIFDVKPPAKAIQFSGKVASSRDFRFISYLLFQKNVFINKVVPVGQSTALFEKTFVADRYIYTDGGTKIRKNVEKYDRIDKWLKDNNIIV